MYYAFLHSAILSESRVSTVISRLYFFILIFTYRKKTKTTSLEELSKMHDIVFLFPKNRKKWRIVLLKIFMIHVGHVKKIMLLLLRSQRPIWFRLKWYFAGVIVEVGNCRLLSFFTVNYRWWLAVTVAFFRQIWQKKWLLPLVTTIYRIAVETLFEINTLFLFLY